jgi:pyruvate formate lyase activating enzyme
MESGLVANIQKYSIQDGPGIRTTVFLKGCPLRCWWCHNLESLSGQPEIIVFESRCIGCGNCRQACPTGAADPATKGDEGGKVSCTLCGACVLACPTGARQLVGKQMTAMAVVTEVLKDRLFYEDSGGGVTFSGGEPLAQPLFLKELLEVCHARGIHTTVDTCGYATREHLLSVAPLTDLFLYDLKIMDDARHHHYTSVSNIPILENLTALGKIHNNIWLRMPVIPGINDDDENLEALGRFAASIPAVRQVNLLPYHKTGIVKFKRLRQTYRLEDVTDPSPEDMEKARQKFCAFLRQAQDGEQSRTIGLVAKTGG